MGGVGSRGKQLIKSCASSLEPYFHRICFYLFNTDLALYSIMIPCILILCLIAPCCLVSCMNKLT